MGIQLEKLNKKIPNDRPIPVKQGRVRGNKNIFNVGLTTDSSIRKYYQFYAQQCCLSALMYVYMCVPLYRV